MVVFAGLGPAVRVRAAAARGAARRHQLVRPGLLRGGLDGGRQRGDAVLHPVRPALLRPRGAPTGGRHSRLSLPPAQYGTGGSTAPSPGGGSGGRWPWGHTVPDRGTASVQGQCLSPACSGRRELFSYWEREGGGGAAVSAYPAYPAAVALPRASGAPTPAEPDTAFSAVPNAAFSYMCLSAPSEVYQCEEMSARDFTSEKLGRRRPFLVTLLHH